MSLRPTVSAADIINSENFDLVTSPAKPTNVDLIESFRDLSDDSVTIQDPNRHNHSISELSGKNKESANQSSQAQEKVTPVKRIG